MSDLTGRIFAGRYELVRTLAQGGMSIVYLAREVGLDRSVAVKVIRRDLVSRPDVLLRFENEAKVIKSLSHPNTIRMLDSGRTESGELYLVTELLSGRSVAEELRKGTLPFDRLIWIAEQICGALAEAHAAGIIHRDIKPDNIFVDDGEPPAVKLLDFGVAKLRDHLSITAHDVLLGTLPYVSPETAGRSDIDHRADIYSLGVTMYQMVTGQVPFTSAKAFEVVQGHLFEKPPPIRTARPDVPPALEALILRMLEKDPDARPASVDAVRSWLGAIRLDAGSAVPSFDDEAPTESTEAKTAVVDPEALPKKPSSRNLATIAVATMVLSLAAFVGSALMEPPPEPPLEAAREPALEAAVRAPVEPPPPDRIDPPPREEVKAPEPPKVATLPKPRAPKKPRRQIKKSVETPEADPPKREEKPRPLPVTF